MRENLKKILVTIIISIMMVAQTGIVSAADYVVGIRLLRDDPERIQRTVPTIEGSSGEVPTQGDTTPYGYKLSGNVLDWKLLDYTENEAADPTTEPTVWDQAIYCLDQGLGFAAEDGTGSLTLTQIQDLRITYNISEVMRIKLEGLNSPLGEGNLNTFPNILLKSIDDAETYNKVLWVLDHCFLPKSDSRTDLRKALLSEMISFMNDPANAVYFGSETNQINPFYITDDINEILLTDSDIEAVQQAAIWRLTNFDTDSNWENLPTIDLVSSDGTVVSALAELGQGDTDEGMIRFQEARLLYKYLIVEASKDLTLYSVQREVDPTIVMADSTSILEKTETTSLIGPFQYTLTENGKRILKTSIEVKAIDGTHSTLTTLPESSYTIKKADKTTTATIEEVEGENFYVLITDATVTDATVTVKTQYYKPEVTKWSVEGEETTQQPIAIIEPAILEVSDTMGLNGVFDLALRKYITKINNVALTNTRNPNVDTTTLGTETTATYEHKKDPVAVKTGDVITYCITIYNEGDIAGRALKIIDQLPVGLEFVQVKTAGYDGEVLTAGVGDEQQNLLEITKLGTNNLSPYTGTGALSSETIEIELEVTATSDTATKVLTNIAWISEDTGGIDRDSSPANNPNVADENLTSYIGNGSNKTDLTDSNYFYKGQEDDDDFEKIVLPGQEFDLHLRKFITKINDQNIISRIPQVDVTDLNKTISGEYITDAIYMHPKDTLSVKLGDIVTYTIRIYNEGGLSGYAEEIADYIPEGLGYLVQHETNYNNQWQIPTDPDVEQEKLNNVTNRLDNVDLSEYEGITDISQIDVVLGQAKITTDKLKYVAGSTTNLIAAYDAEATNPVLSYKDVQVTCIVLEPETSTRILKNVAEVTEDANESGTAIIDRDSTPDNVTISSYPNNNSMEDDDDFEALTVTYFDLALRKFITRVNSNLITNRVPMAVPDNGDIKYEHTKDPVYVKSNDVVTYTLRIFNEGKISGYAEEIKDFIPAGTQFVADNVINQQYEWKMYKIVSGAEVEITDPSKADEATIIRTDYLSRAKGVARGDNNLIEAFDGQATITEEGTYYDLDYRDVQIVLKVFAPNTTDGVLRNIAEISEDADDQGDPVIDKDSQPDNYPIKEQDDDDYDDIVLRPFDLALRKFITAVRDLDVEQQVTDRVPSVSYADGKISYKHPKTPIVVSNSNIVTYTIRVYNEGKVDGYVEEITDDIPEGLEFLPENAINEQYEWQVSEDGKKITTDYLSRAKSAVRGEDNLIKAFDEETGISATNPDYRDVKIVFLVTEENVPSDRIIINTAEISKDADTNGDPVDDVDSTPANNEEDEDDIDKEYIVLKYFDLALLKYVSKVFVTENGKTTVKETGYNGTENPEPVVKVDLNRKKINNVTVKFGYTIKVTNQGEIAGYATEVKDYIPEGLKFIAEDNPDWKVVEEQKVYSTDKLKDTLLQPGQSATVEIVLTWINDEDNMGLKINVAEISEDKNDYGAKDVDSDPDNKKEGEDDIDEAHVMLSVSTGESVVYFTLSGAILMILAGGVILIKKYVL